MTLLESAQSQWTDIMSSESRGHAANNTNYLSAKDRRSRDR